MMTHTLIAIPDTRSQVSSFPEWCDWQEVSCVSSRLLLCGSSEDKELMRTIHKASGTGYQR